MIGGEFTNLNGTTRNYLVRLNADGTVDGTFYTNLGTSFDNKVQASILSGTNILVTGLFIDLNSTPVKGIVKLDSTGVLNTTFNDVVLTNLLNGAPGVPSWVCPAGVTSVTVVPVDTTSGGATNCNPTIVTVVPNTTYTITVLDSTYNLGSLNTFGAVYSWTGTDQLLIIWGE